MSSHNRFNSIETALGRERVGIETPSGIISELFGSNVFGDILMQAYLDPAIYQQIVSNRKKDIPLSREIAEHVANAMRKWALEHGVSHYAHWFQPLTGRTAEKHDSFFTLDGKGNPIETFDANTLVQQEPDGSSFPGGGLRTTFEARGYTAWDPTSPAFILEVNEVKTLCIPTIFVTYGGHSLDYKLPLLKSQRFLEIYAKEVCQLFDETVERVFVTLGWEQEYFLLDEALFHNRLDLQLTGRTLVGKRAAKGQRMEDHYFGAIPERVLAFMRDLEIEAHKLGIPVRTRHNEVAPTQYELAPIYEELNVAIDHNQLLMDLMDRIARRHRLRVLLHEKPYAGVNGSGKHNNWSLATDKGKNLLSPGKNPDKNLQFLTFFVNTIQAVHKYADLLRASVASASNDHRLGANEAPPAIVSVFVGETLSKVLDELEKDGAYANAGVKQMLNLLDTLPNLELDNTDRNRTSPFAFTGNKFEVRMVGSSMNCAAPMTVLNMMVGKQLKDFCASVKALTDKGTDKNEAILSIIKQYIKESKPIRFEGDGYSEAWKQEAATRGLSNLTNTPEALDAYVSDWARALFEESGVLSKEEIHAHHEVKLENYIMQLDIESRVLSEIGLNMVVPAAINYQNTLASNVLQLQDIGFGKDIFQAQMEWIKEIGQRVQVIKRGTQELADTRQNAQKLESREKATAYCEKLKPIMERVREQIDHLETIVDDAEWTLPKYRELMMFR
jgi:glutamine synthetase